MSKSLLLTAAAPHLLLRTAPGAVPCEALPVSAAPAHSLSRVAAASPAEGRPHIALRAGVLHAPPFAMRRDDGSYAGFQPDLLGRLTAFADRDGIDLSFDLSPSPPQYGAALDLVAADCNTTDNPNTLEDCAKFDLIVGDYYCNADRSVRVDFTPAWLRTTMSTVKRTGAEGKKSFDTMSQLEAARGTACVPDGTYLMKVAMARHPGAKYYKCPSHQDCLEKLLAGECSLYVDDELLLRYQAQTYPTIELNRENFNTQYLVWPMSNSLDSSVTLLLKKWMYAAVANATLDELYYTYFEVKTCPIGTSGANCSAYCDPKHGEADREGQCICESTKWTGPDCSVEVIEDTNLISPGLKITAYVMFGIIVVAILYCLYWLWRNRTTAQVRVAQPFFLRFVLLGCLISSSSIIALAQEDGGHGPVHACMAIPWLYSVGFCVTFGSLLSKIRRVYILFRNSARMIRATVTVRETLLVVGAILLADVIILAVWTAVDPLRWTRTVTSTDKYGEPLSSYGHCTSDHWAAFVGTIGALHFAVLASACYMCYLARNIPTKFSEGRYLTLAMVSNFQVFLIGLPVLVLAGSNPQSGFFVRTAVIWINNVAVVGLIFGNLMYSVHTNRDNVSVRTAIRTFTDAERSMASHSERTSGPSPPPCGLGGHSPPRKSGRGTDGSNRSPNRSSHSVDRSNHSVERWDAEPKDGDIEPPAVAQGAAEGHHRVRFEEDAEARAAEDGSGTGRESAPAAKLDSPDDSAGGGLSAGLSAGHTGSEGRRRGRPERETVDSLPGA